MDTIGSEVSCLTVFGDWLAVPGLLYFIFSNYASCYEVHTELRKQFVVKK